MTTPYSLRILARRPGFAAATILTLALGIGLTTTVFSVVDAVLLRPLPYADPGRLVTIRSIPARAWLELEAGSHAFQSLTRYDFSYPPLVLQTEDAVTLRQAVVSPDFLSVLGLSPVIGRSFVADDVSPGAEPTVMLTYGVWQQQFGGRADVIGSLAPFEGTPRRIVGVLPAGFVFPMRLIEAAGEVRILTPKADPTPSDEGVSLVGRLRAGATLAAARADEQTIRQSTATRAGGRIEATATTLDEEVLGRSRQPLLLLAAAVGCLLLITCVNVGHLLFARGLERSRELSVRRALGARTRQLLWLVVTESVVISTIGGACGVLLAFWSLDTLLSIVPTQLPRSAGVAIDGRVLLFACVVSLVSGVALGLVPAWRLSGVALQTAMNAQSSATPRRQRGRLAIVSLEVALGVMLLAAAALFGQAFAKLLATDLGFAPGNVLTLRFRPLDSIYPTPDAQKAFITAALERLSGLPGVVSAGAVDLLPVTRARSGSDVQALDRPGAAPVEAEPRSASPGYLETIGVRIVRGRAIGASDSAASEPIAVINETLAARLWPGADPIGRRLRDSRGTARTVAGVAADVRGFAVDTAPSAELYIPYSQYGQVPNRIVIRSTGPAAPLAAAVRERLHDLDPRIPIEQVRPLDALVTASIAGPRFQAILLGLFGACGFLLSAIGIAGVVAHAVSTRTREIGIRIALGAARAHVRRTVMGPTLAAVAIGLAAGAASSLWLTGLVRALLYGVDAQDPLTLGGVTLLLGATAVAAAWIPARRATRIDPIVALRTE